MPDPQDQKTTQPEPPPKRDGYVEFAAEIEIFRAGKYPQGEFTREDLDRIAETYDPSVHEAPITLDHKSDGPAFGWIGKVRRVADRLVAIPSQVSERMKELVKAGDYRKVSAELYTDFMGMGRPYLKAVSFLGARAPQVKGLAPAQFNEDFGKHVTVPFEKEEDEMTPEEIKAIVNDSVKTAVTEFKEKNEELATQLKDTEAKFAEADQKAKDVAAKLAERDEADKARAEKAHTERVATFCDKLKEEGKLLPAWEDGGLRQFMQSLDSGSDKVVEFVEGANVKKVTQLAFMEGFLSELPTVIHFAEIAKRDTQKAASTAMFNADADDVVNTDLRDKAVEIFEEENAKGKKLFFGEALKRARASMAE